MSWAVSFRDELNKVSTWIVEELDHLIAQISATFEVEHDVSGTHKDLTGYSIILVKDPASIPPKTGNATIGGNLSVAGSATFNGNLTADADGTPVVIGNDSVLRAFIRLTDGTANDWMIHTGSGTRELSFRDVLETGDASMLDVIRTGASAYDIRKHASSTTLNIGTDVANQRMSGVSADTFTGGLKGTWIPDLKVGGSAAGITYTSRSARYTRICDLVFVDFTLLLSNKGAGAGALTIDGLPYSAGAVATNTYDPASNPVLLTAPPYLAIVGATLFLLTVDAASNRVQIMDTNINNTSQIQGSLVFRV